jgi:serine/threonine-protein kinase
MNDDPLIGRRLANFRVERALGRGGMAQVYYGQDTKLKRPVAIKVIDARYRGNPAYAQRFVREAQTIATWRHEHIIQIHYADDEDGFYYFVMEYVDGQDLGQLLAQYTAQGKLLPPTEVLRIGRAVASALDYAHQRGVIHRDVKPSNVLVAKDGRIVLADFGLALDVEQGSLGEVFGSANYISPEQARHSADAIPQSDLYSLGIILYEMLTGRVPFDDPSATTVAVQHLTLPPPPPRTLNPALNKATEAVLLKALSKSPAKRYQTGQELMDALAKAMPVSQVAAADPTMSLVKTPQPVATSATPSPNSRQFIYLGMALGGGVVLILLVLLAVGFWLLRNSGEEIVEASQTPRIETTSGVEGEAMASPSSKNDLNATNAPAEQVTIPAPTIATPTHTPAASLAVTFTVTLAPSALTPSQTPVLVLPTPSPTPTLTPTPTIELPTATATPTELPTATPKPEPLPIADTQGQFSGSQGVANWEYQWSQGRESFNWTAMRFDGTCWRTTNTEEYVRICEASGHPGLTGDIAWRWTSEVTGRVQVWLSAHKIDIGGGDGVVILVYRNTEEIKRWQLGASDGQGFTDLFGLDIAQGDYLFFVIKVGGDSMNDETALRVQIYP